LKGDQNRPLQKENGSFSKKEPLAKKKKRGPTTLRKGGGTQRKTEMPVA